MMRGLSEATRILNHSFQNQVRQRVFVDFSCHMDQRK